jgi:hypothetical protein
MKLPWRIKLILLKIKSWNNPKERQLIDIAWIAFKDAEEFQNDL